MPLLVNTKPRRKQKRTWAMERPSMRSPASVSAITANATFRAASIDTRSPQWLPRPLAEVTRAAAGRSQSRGRHLRKAPRSLVSSTPKGPARTVATANMSIVNRRAPLVRRARGRRKVGPSLLLAKAGGGRAAGDRKRGVRKSGGPPLAFLPLACLRLCGAPALAYLRMRPVSDRGTNRRAFV